jgi:hypothetical protein
MISSGINLVMTIIGFAVSTMFIVFVCTRLICARIHLNASRRSFLIASRSNLSLVGKKKFVFFFFVKLFMQLKMGFWIYELGFFFLQMERGCQGIERIDVAKFPVKKYSDKFFAAGENSQYTFISIMFCDVHLFTLIFA